MMQKDEALRYAVALSIASQNGGGFWDEMDKHRPNELFEITGCADKPVQPFLTAVYSRNVLSAADEIIRELAKLNIKATHYWAEDYPPLLREIKQPPVVLYYVGRLPIGRAVGVVGTRNPSQTSIKITNRIVSRLIKENFCVVSGMAIGIDGVSHSCALELGGRTVGVLANGINMVYPVANKDLYMRISRTSNSCLVSEYPPNISAGKWTFSRRNRIISGLCRALVVIQAGVKSGTLITARFAAEQGREVFVCPGHALDADFAGSNRLISQGAAVLWDLDEFSASLNSLPYDESDLSEFTQREKSSVENTVDKKPQPSAEIKADGVGGQILAYLADKSADIDTVIRECGISPGDFQEAIVLLEMEGLVVRKGNILSL